MTIPPDLGSKRPDPVLETFERSLGCTAIGCGKLRSSASSERLLEVEDVPREVFDLISQGCP
jgi:hypothetical protein